MSSNTTPAPKPKPHSCNKCTRSFTTSQGLHDHGLSTGHCIPCTTSGCKRKFSSEGALRDHLASSVHASRKPVAQNEQTVKVKSPVPNRANGTTSSKQQHACTAPGCAKSFKTLEARAQHLDSAVHAKAVAATPIVVIDSAKKSGPVQQNHTCTAPGCKKSFKTVEARAQHLDSAAHKKAVTATGPHKREDAKAMVMIASAPNTRFENACTAPGCRRVFKTSRARAQHLDSTVHKRSATKEASRAHNGKTSIVVASSGKSSTPFERQSVSIVEAASSKEGLAARHGTTGISQVQTKTPSAKKPPQSSHSTDPKGSEKNPLFPWDTRWTSIPHSSHAETITALHSLLTPPRTQLPSSSHTEPTLKRRAIVLDCEMVGVGPKGTISALARLSAIDFLTGELLIDILVQPFKPVIDWRTTWSGITPALFKAAKAKGQVLEGTAAARKELLQYMDARTILVGHALHYDLKALGIGHTVTIDSAKLARAAVGNSVKKDWGLKVLCKELLGITVQDHGKNGHDSVEDALAARELVLWCLRHPEELGGWGARKKEEVEAKKREDAEKKRKKISKQSGVIIAGTREVSYLDDSDDDWEFQNMSLREFNEMCGYPSDYDNWSD